MRLELPLLVSAVVAIVLAAALLALSLFADASVAALLVVAFGAAVAMSTATGVQDGRRLRKEGYARQGETEESYERIWRQAIEEAFESGWLRQGRLGEVRYAIEPEVPFPEFESIALTKRDRALIALIAAGFPLRDIAGQLNVSRETARKEWSRLERRLGAILRAMQGQAGREEPEP